MKIEPLSGPKVVEGALQKNVNPIETARERAIKKLVANSPHAEAPTVKLSAPTPTYEEPKQSQPIEAAPEGQSSTQVEQTLSSEPVAAPEATQAAPSEEPQRPPLSAQFAQLARKERALQAQARELKALQAQFKAEQEALKAPAQPQFDPKQFLSREQLKSDPWSVLNELGVSYEELTQQALNAPSPDVLEARRMINELRSELQAVKAAQDTASKSAEARQSEQYQSSLKQLKFEASNLIKSDPAFEACQVYGSQATDTIVELIESTYHNDGYLMSVEDAAREVEEHFTAEAEKLARIKKIQDRLKPATPAPKQQTESKPQQPQLKTLTNAVGSSRPLSARDRAIAAAEGRLNK